MNFLTDIFRTIYVRVDWILFGAILILSGLGLLTMNSFGDDNYFFTRQVIWLSVGISFFFLFSLIDFRFLRRPIIVVSLFCLTCLMLVSLYALGSVFSGSQRWIDLGFFTIQPTDIAKIVLVIVLAKYFSRRHVEIAHVKHILVSGFYAFIFFVLVFLQPDFGSAIIIALIWLGMVLISGISKKHLLVVFVLGVVTFSGLWGFVFQDYQKNRIISFLHPLTDLQGSGYNAYQSMIAVGSGELFGKGVGYGTQSRLAFLPEYETDFIFAAFAEEWGFMGSLFLFLLFFVITWRIIKISIRGASNFEILYGAGIAIIIVNQFAIHVGMNIGLLPITGTTLPFVSYGGSHIVTMFLALGILMGMRGYSRTAHSSDTNKEVFIT